MAETKGELNAAVNPPAIGYRSPARRRRSFESGARLDLSLKIIRFRVTSAEVCSGQVDCAAEATQHTIPAMAPS